MTALADMDFSVFRAIAVALLPVLVWWASRGRRRAWWRRPATWALLALATVSVTQYVRLGFASFDDEIIGYDVYHYYMGAKYRRELGTERIYACTVVADAERRKPRFGKLTQVRDLRTYDLEPIADVRRDKEACKAHFSPTRWRQFKRDLHYFQRVTKRWRWATILIDRGVNASPVWHLFGGAVARMVPTADLGWAAAVDVVLLGVALVAVAWAFGVDVALAALVFLVACFSTRWPQIGRAFFRYDWMAATLVGVALLRRRYPALAGAAFAFATGVRIFPVVLLAGLAAKGVRQVAGVGLTGHGHGLLGSERRLVGGFVAAFAVLCGAALVDGGTRGFHEFGVKIGKHASADSVSVMRVGLPIAAAYRGEGLTRGSGKAVDLTTKRALVRRDGRLFHVLALLLFLALLALAPRCDDGTLLVLAFALFPLALQASYYYYVLMLAPLLVHFERADRAPHRLAMFFLCWLNAAAFIAHSMGAARYTLLAVGSYLVAAYCVGVLLYGAIHARGRASLPDHGWRDEAGGGWRSR